MTFLPVFFHLIPFFCFCLFHFTIFAVIKDTSKQFNNPLNRQHMDLTNILGALTGNDAVGAISENLKIDSKQVSSVITAALPSLLGAMQKNASTESGAASLAKALGDHAASNLKTNDLTDGNKILSHIFGGNLSNVLGGISKSTGTSTNQVSGILASIAPMLLSILGKNQQSSNTGAAGLAGMLGSILGGSSSNSGLGSILGAAMSDKDGDGKPDILGGLGSIFGKK